MSGAWCGDISNQITDQVRVWTPQLKTSNRRPPSQPTSQRHSKWNLNQLGAFPDFRWMRLHLMGLNPAAKLTVHPKRLIVQHQLLAVPWKLENTEKRMASWVENNSSPLLFRSRPLIKIEPVFSYWATLVNCPTVFFLFRTFAFLSWNKNQHEQIKSTRRSSAMFFIIIMINLSQKHHQRWR